MKESAANRIKEYMRNEALKPKSAFKMPSMRQLTKHFNVSMVTVTRAVKALEAEGVIVCRHGSGIVAARESLQNSNYTTPSGSGKNGCVVLAVIDYPSDTIWNRAYMIEQCAIQNGYRVISCKLHQDTKPVDIINFTEQQESCAGLILIPSIIQFSHDEVQSFGQLSMPVVFVHGMFEYVSLPRNVYMVGRDPDASGTLAAKCLYERGHRDIGLVRNEPMNEYTEIFIKAATNFLKQTEENAKLHYFSSIIRNWGNAKEEARRITGENIANIRLKNITALIYLSSDGAFAAQSILKSAGFRLPEDISVVAETDNWFCNYSDPTITAITPDHKAMCLRALEIITGTENCKEQYFKVKEELVIRDSVKNIAPSSITKED